MKKETTKKGNKVTTIYDIKKEYPAKTITLTVQQ